MHVLDQYEDLLRDGAASGAHLLHPEDEAKWEQWWEEMETLAREGGISTRRHVDSCGAGSYHFPGLRVVRPDGSEYASDRDWVMDLPDTKRRLEEDYGEKIARERLRIQELRRAGGG